MNDFNPLLPLDIVHQLSELKMTINSAIGNNLQQLSSIKKECGLDENIESLTLWAEEIESLDVEEFYNSYNDRIKNSEFLGSNGWVVSEHCTPPDLSEWVAVIQEQGEEGISKYFEDYMETFLEITKSEYNALPEKLYVEKAINDYKEAEYMETAMLLLGTIDKKLRKITPQNISSYTKKCSDYGFQEAKADIFQKTAKKPATKIIFLTEYIPSLIAFLQRVFVHTKALDLDTGIEPPFLNRNWLMHGRLTREIKKYECIQLFNALDTLNAVEEELNHD